ncbi:MAG TPA: potassium-transporting ATPase subunit B, partial [Solirubrobacteraceae bacterium]|nr:potassium-transporting ATPase subunit B [Solirubrobacteraceae bacterium]
MTSKQSSSLFRRELMWPALVASVRKLDPRVQLRNPVMFVVEVGAVLTTIAVVYQIFSGNAFGGGNETLLFTITVTIWLWLTVVFANFAEALAEGRGKAQADTLRAMRTETVAHMQDGTTRPASELHRGDVVVVEAGEV